MSDTFRRYRTRANFADFFPPGARTRQKAARALERRSSLRHAHSMRRTSPCAARRVRKDCARDHAQRPLHARARPAAKTGRNSGTGYSASRRSRPRLARRRCGRSTGELNPARESEQQLLRRLRPAAPIGRWPNTSSHFWSSRRRRPAQMVAEAHESWIGSHGSVRQGLRGQAGSFWGSPGWLAGSARADSTNFFIGHSSGSGS